MYLNALITQIIKRIKNISEIRVISVLFKVLLKFMYTN